jgi:hypothetical protein
MSIVDVTEQNESAEEMTNAQFVAELSPEYQEWSESPKTSRRP